MFAILSHIQISDTPVQEMDYLYDIIVSGSGLVFTNENEHM